MDNFWEGFEKRAAGKTSIIKGIRRAGAILSSKSKPIKSKIGDYLTHGSKKPVTSIKGVMGKKLTKAQAGRGLDSLSGGGLSWLGGKVFGKKRARKAVEKLHGAAAQVDTRAGSLLRKVPGIGKAFVQKEKVPIGLGFHKNMYRTSAMAPISSVSKFVIPMAGMMKIEESLNKAKKTKEATHG